MIFGYDYTGDIKGRISPLFKERDHVLSFGGSVVDDKYAEAVGGGESAIREEINPGGLITWYYFTTGDLDDINLGIDECLEHLGESKIKLDQFFGIKSDYTLPEIKNLLNLTREETLDHLECYSKLQLGKKIKDRVEGAGSCYFATLF